MVARPRRCSFSKQPRTRASAASAEITCRYQDGDSWEFTEIAFDGVPISSTELMLVNAELLFRDLRDSPERFASAPSPADDG